MKTVISVPDDVFEQAERLARLTKKSRSQLFSDALREYLARHSPDLVTEAMDAVGAGPDPLVSQTAHQILKDTEW